jgi:membrane protein DedA with SNARE-associated domain
MKARATVIGAVVWAVGFLVSAFLLKGNPAGDWVEGALLAGWIVFVSLAARPTRREAEAGR